MKANQQAGQSKKFLEESKSLDHKNCSFFQGNSCCLELRKAFQMK